jgi:hypothetical protein
LRALRSFHSPRSLCPPDFNIAVPFLKECRLK